MYLEGPADRRFAGPAIQRGRNPFERFGIDHRLATTLPSAAFRWGEPHHCALARQRALILSQRPEQREQQFAMRLHEAPLNLTSYDAVSARISQQAVKLRAYHWLIAIISNC